MGAAGIHRVDGSVEALDLPESRALAPDEVLVEVAAAGVGNWDDIVRTALGVQDGQTLLVHGASGLTGGMIVELAALRGLRVIATAGPAAYDRVRALGASEVVDYHDEDWPSQVLRFSGGGVHVAANAARGGAVTVAESYSLADADTALAKVVKGTGGTAVVITPV